MSKSAEINSELFTPQTVNITNEQFGFSGDQPVTPELELACSWMQVAQAKITEIKLLDNDETELDLLDELQVKLDLLAEIVAADDLDCIDRLAALAIEAGINKTCDEANRAMVHCQLEMLMQVVLMEE